MKRMAIEKDTTLAEALEYYPGVFPALRQLGLCCVNPDNENMTMEELCLQFGAEPEAFLDALNRLS